MSDPDVRSGLELLASKEVGWIAHVACHTERVAIQKESTTTTGVTDPDVRAGPELLVINELKWKSHGACHAECISIQGKLANPLHLKKRRWM
jgi:hypothetical protein